MNRDEVKQILLLYRPGTTDAEDPEVAEALALANGDPELSRWLAEHNARQSAMREKFRQIPVLAGLKEQIVSEQAAKSKAASRRSIVTGVAAVAAILIALLLVAHSLLPQGDAPGANTLNNYKSQMAYTATSGYAMDLASSDAGKIQAYLAGAQAPSDYVLPAGMQNVAMTGCAIEMWRKTKATMICFRTGKTLPQGQAGDLWLFVIDRSAIDNVPDMNSPRFAEVNGLMTATWTQGDKLYLLGARGDKDDIKKFL